MITAIIPVPMRYPLGYNLGTGFRVNKKVGICGRTVVVLPLYFYKFFSVYGNTSYQHIFASDSVIDPITLESSRNNFNLQRDNTGGVLVPVSVKRLGETRANTFLFPRSINFLLQRYRNRIPLDEVPLLDDVGKSELAPGCPGVIGVSEFNFFYLKHFMERTNWCGLDPSNRRFMSSMTPEAPDRISNYVSEIISCRLYGDELATYISDLCAYETGTACNMREFLEMSKYNFPLDPITLLCVNTPSYLYGKQLQPFLGNEMSLRHYGCIGYRPPDDAFSKSAVNLGFEQADPYYWSDEVMEDLLNMADEDFKLTVTRNGPLMESFSIIGNNTPSIIEHLYQSLLHSFTTYEKIEIIKTWAEEVFMTMWSNGIPHTYYMNLAWYHLISPSLINMNLVNQ